MYGTIQRSVIGIAAVLASLVASQPGDGRDCSGLGRHQPPYCGASSGRPIVQKYAGPPILLVHGLTIDPKQPSKIWGRFESGRTRRWTGMIGYLQSKGLRFGGVIAKPSNDFNTPGVLDKVGVEGNPDSADFFVLQFTSEAKENGLGYKAAQLATSIQGVCRLTGARKVRIVAHSAGGLVARAYLQDYIPLVKYSQARNVDRLITISTPHLGSAAAGELGIVGRLGELFGTRVRALDPKSATINKLSQKDLPHDVDFASIVVRSIGHDIDGEGEAYDHLVDKDFLAGLPVDFKRGGDGVLSVRTQNLRLAECAKRFEKATGRAVQYASVRVPGDTIISPSETAHNKAVGDPVVQDWVYRFLIDDGDCWRGSTGWPHREEWIDRAARACAAGIVEGEMYERYDFIGVEGCRIWINPRRRETVPGFGEEAVSETWHYEFWGDATWRSLTAFSPWTYRLRGRLHLNLDRFGRIVRHEYSIDGIERLVSERPDNGSRNCRGICRNSGDSTLKLTCPAFPDKQGSAQFLAGRCRMSCLGVEFRDSGSRSRLPSGTYLFPHTRLFEYPTLGSG